MYHNSIRLIRNNTNLGFAEGNNLGIAAAHGEYIVVLNTDAIADCNWLKELVVQAQESSDIGMVGSKILLANSPGHIDSVGINIYPDGMSRQRGHLEHDDGQYSRVEEILLPSACAALYKKQMLDQIGYFDADFFAYCEDTDLGLRGRLAGWRAVLAPSAIVHHQYSSSAGKYSAFKAYQVERNHFWLAIKTFPLNMLIMVPYHSIIRLFSQCWDILTFSCNANPDTGIPINKIEVMKAVLKAYLAALKGIPGMLRKRNEIHSRQNIPNREFKSLLQRFDLKIMNLRLDR